MKKVILVIFDGFGMRDEKLGNAVLNADMPNFNYLLIQNKVLMNYLLVLISDLK